MASSRHYDTVTFDVRDDATMLFFARTSQAGDIEDYLLLMRAAGEDLDEAIYIEINENQFSGHDLIEEARMTGNMLTLELRESSAELDGAFPVLGDTRRQIPAGTWPVRNCLSKGGGRP